MNDLSDITFWHACRRKDLPSIRDHGLLPLSSRSKSKAIYLSDDRFTAENYANFDPDEEWVVLEIKGADLDEGHLIVDDYEFPEFMEGMADETMAEFGLDPAVDWFDMGWAASLKVCNQVGYEGIIPSASLVVHELSFAQPTP